MKRSVLIALCLVLGASVAFAQLPGSIDIFSDYDSWGDICFYDTAPALMPMYVVHVRGELVASSQWMLHVPECASTMTFTGATYPFAAVIGNVLTGVSIAYGTCLGGSPILVATVNWFVSGGTPNCCYFGIVPDPAVSSGRIEVADCDLNRMFATGGEAIVNPVDGVCGCTWPVHETTWGQVKALYR